MNTKILFFVISGLALSLAPYSSVYADTPKDFETIAKAIGFIDGGPTGPVTMDILYDPTNPSSAAHADEVMTILAPGVGDKVILSGRKITSPAEATSKIIFITKGTASMHAAALSKAAALGGLTVSTDESCLGTGCVMVVKTQPSVDIIVHTGASGKTGTEFASAFSMMITKK